MHRLELKGQTFGRLTVQDRATRANYWICACQCGNTATVHGPSLVSGNTMSCGCRGRTVLGENTRTHGRRHTQEYQSWASMKQRCYNPKNPGYHKWGGRGITVCDRWRTDFAAFFADMGPKPTPQHTIERVNNDWNYSPENCVWATKSEQSLNTRHNRPLTFQGRTQLASEWCRELGIKRPTLSRRLNALGWSIDRALSDLVKRDK